jgi:hypothetical protein
VDGLVEDDEHDARGRGRARVPTVAEITGQEPRDVAGVARDDTGIFASGAG